jgi:hypothetical protein
MAEDIGEDDVAGPRRRVLLLARGARREQEEGRAGKPTRSADDVSFRRSESVWILREERNRRE